MLVPTRPNERWSLDFVHDQLADGRRFRILNIVDDYSRVCVGQLVDLSISGARMMRYLEQLRETRGLYRTIVLDNGPEMTSKAMFFWSQETKVKLHFIQPGKPTQNAFVESFNGFGTWLMQGRSSVIGEITTMKYGHTVHLVLHRRQYTKHRRLDMMKTLSVRLVSLLGKAQCH
jgi:transposase InsO family protein